MISPAAVTELLEFLLPRACLGCGGGIPPEGADGLVCDRCRSLLRAPPPPRCPRCDLPRGTGRAPDESCLECADWPQILRTARGAVVMEAPADALVHALKYDGWRGLARPMGRRMAPLLAGNGKPGGLMGMVRGGAEPVLVPVPTTRKRERARGYNQARVLAEALKEFTGLSVVDALERPVGRTQVHLGPAERRANVQGGFRLKPSLCSRIEGRRVILVDDVLTTGATAISAAESLGEGGAGEVHVVTFARALPFSVDGHRTQTS